MRSKYQRPIRDGTEYDHLIPPASGETITLSKDVDVEITVPEMERIICEKAYQTEKLAKLFKARTVRQTCKNVYDFVKDHIRYKLDRAGKEELREPARAWADRQTGIDCDCYSIFISTILCNLGIAHELRVTAYKKKYDYQHVYPVAFAEDGKEIILDCVLDEFDTEEPFISPAIHQPIMTNQLSGAFGRLGETTPPATTDKKFDPMQWAKDNPWIVASIVVALIVIVYLLFFNKKKKTKRRLSGCGCNRSTAGLSGAPRRRRRSTPSKTTTKRKRRRKSK